VPSTTKQVVLVPPGAASIRIPKVGTGDNDQPSVLLDEFGYRCVFRSAGPGGTGPSNVQLYSLTRSAGKTETGTVAITKFDSTAGNNYAAFDPSFTARTRVREVESGVKVRERDARIAFVSTGDLTARDATHPGANPDHLEQLFLWEEQEHPHLRQITRNEDAEAKVSRPSVSISGDVIAFESTADLVPASVDPLDASRVGNPGRVRQVFLWRRGRALEQITWSDGDCFSPRLDANARVVLFSSRGDPLTGGNPQHNIEIFSWSTRGHPQLRLSQLTETALGDSVLPRPAMRRRGIFAFWSTAHPPVARVEGDPAPAFGEGPRECEPQALLYDHGRISHMHGYLDTANDARTAAQQNPVLTGPPALGTDALRFYFATNDWLLNPPITRLTGETDAAFAKRREAASLTAMYVAIAKRSMQR
jgi:hypothetical protein